MEITDHTTIERIRQVAREMFMHYGFRSVTMDDLAVKLGMSKKTIYQHFADKSELVKEVVDETIKENKLRCSHCQIKSDNPVHEVWLTMEFFHHFMQSLNPAAIFDLQKYHPEIYARYTRFVNEYVYDFIYQNMAEGIKGGYYRSDINAEVLTRYRVNTLFTVFDPVFYKDKNGPSLFEVHNEIFRNFLYGLVSEKGYKLVEKYRLQKNQTKTISHS